jgi:hypothetical protein
MLKITIHNDTVVTSFILEGTLIPHLQCVQRRPGKLRARPRQVSFASGVLASNR